MRSVAARANEGCSGAARASLLVRAVCGSANVALNRRAGSFGPEVCERANAVRVGSGIDLGAKLLQGHFFGQGYREGAAGAEAIVELLQGALALLDVAVADAGDF